MSSHSQRSAELKRVSRSNGFHAMCARIEAADPAGEFTNRQLAEILGVSANAVQYARQDAKARQKKRERQREARRDPLYRAVENFKRRMRREKVGSTDSRTKAQKCRDAALTRQRNSLGQLVSGTYQQSHPG